MRLLKAQNTNLRNIYGEGVRYDIDGQVVMDTTNMMLIPKGTTAERITTPVNGHMRYNISLDGDGNEIGFEFYYDAEWRRVSYKEPKNVVYQSLGTGDDTETVFGPLNSQDPDYPIPASGKNIIVLIENVFQLDTTNYDLVQSSAGNLTGPNAPYADGWYIKFGSPVPTGKPVTVIHNFDK